MHRFSGPKALGNPDFYVAMAAAVRYFIDEPLDSEYADFLDEVRRLYSDGWVGAAWELAEEVHDAVRQQVPRGGMSIPFVRVSGLKDFLHLEAS